jgi:ubiquinone biosynthesis O-methyltransferase
MLEEIKNVLDSALKNSDIKHKAKFSQLIREELADMPNIDDFNKITHEDLNNLYEIRAKVLDWELGTGYLGFFAKNKGTRYTFTRRLEIMMKLMPPLENKTVLEVGCGAGIISLELAKTSKKVVGIDVTETALDFGRKLASALNYSHVEFKKGDAEHLEFDDNSFDIVVCSEVLEHLIHPESAISEFHRVLKADGILLLTTPCATTPSEKFTDFVRIFIRRIQVEKEHQFDKKTYHAMKKKGNEISPEKFYRIHRRFGYSDLVKMFEQCGFKVLDAKGAIFAFPPLYSIFFRYCPFFLLPLIKKIEYGLNGLKIFQRFGSVTTCFNLKKNIHDGGDIL